MSKFIVDRAVSRRALLRTLLAGAAGLPLLTPGAARALQTVLPAQPYPFKLGLQSYTLKKYGLEEALQKSKSLGLHWWEGYPGHLPITDDAGKIAGYKQLLQANNVRMIAYGVLDFTNDEADARSKFQFAKAMGIETLTASPRPDSLPMLDKLTQEFGVNIAIHNHGPEDKQWGDWRAIESAVENLGPRMGACDDTGHYLRADKNPITAAVDFGKRLFSIHMKAVEQGPNGAKPFVPIGTTGALLDVVQLLRFMKDKMYDGILAIEDEENLDDPIPGLTKSVGAMRRYINTVNTIKLKSD